MHLQSCRPSSSLWISLRTSGFTLPIMTLVKLEPPAPAGDTCCTQKKSPVAMSSRSAEVGMHGEDVNEKHEREGKTSNG